MSEFVANVHAGVAWQEAGPRSAGNGALMRIALVLVPHPIFELVEAARAMFWERG